MLCGRFIYGSPKAGPSVNSVSKLGETAVVEVTLELRETRSGENMCTSARVVGRGPGPKNRRL